MEEASDGRFPHIMRKTDEHEHDQELVRQGKFSLACRPVALGTSRRAACSLIYRVFKTTSVPDPK